MELGKRWKDRYQPRGLLDGDEDEDRVGVYGIVEWFSIVALPVLCSFFPQVSSSVVSPHMLSSSAAPFLTCSISPFPMYLQFCVFDLFSTFSWNTTCLKN